MIKSMTGFGKAEGFVNKKRVSVEIRSVNSKGMDVNTRMSGPYREKELDIRSLLSEKLERGKIDFSINVESSEGGRSTQINTSIVKNYHVQLKSLAKELKEEQDDFMEIIMRLPEVFKIEKEEFNEAEWKQMLKLIGAALKKINSFREKEGASLEKDLRKRIDLIAKLLTEVEKDDKERMAAVKEKLRKAVEELAAKDKIDNNRFEQELIYYLEKLDITEEKVRLKTHLDYFLKTMNENSPGKKLGFISQEIGREINTIGSKANDADMQKRVVQMKDELEKIKEQLNNVL
ncbi:MAG: YicC family protein [Bacteroidetes bacterium]|nr:MAG: YicC family protein [Bacteroidota bacterium]